MSLLCFALMARAKANQLEHTELGSEAERRKLQFNALDLHSCAATAARQAARKEAVWRFLTHTHTHTPAQWRWSLLFAAFSSARSPAHSCTRTRTLEAPKSNFHRGGRRFGFAEFNYPLPLSWTTTTRGHSGESQPTKWSWRAEDNNRFHSCFSLPLGKPSCPAQSAFRSRHRARKPRQISDQAHSAHQQKASEKRAKLISGHLLRNFVCSLSLCLSRRGAEFYQFSPSLRPRTPSSFRRAAVARLVRSAGVELEMETNEKSGAASQLVAGG